MPSVMRAFLAFALVALSACGASDEPIAPPTAESVVGIYTLFNVNGGALPFLFAADGVTRVEYVSGSLTLNADRTITDVLTFRVSRVDGTGTPTTSTSTFTGTYTLAGNTVTATYTGVPEAQALVVTGNQITHNEEGVVLSYRK
jgi:hypothetical protein